MNELEWVLIPAGMVRMGSESGGDDDERPAQSIALASFRMTKTPITNAQYQEFVQATGRAAPGHWEGETYPERLAQHAVTYVSWHEANAFAEWMGGRLPTEAEWERAARGDDARIYPWGNQEPDATRANYNANIRTTCAVGQFPSGASAFGLLDMAGNVWEWVNSLYRPYPYDANDGREEMKTNGMRVVRGGSYIHPASDIRAAARYRFYSAACDPYIGFRIVRHD